MPSTLTLTVDQARRLAVGAQCLASPGPVSMEQVLRRLRCLQLDPIDVVARSHLLVLWSRLGSYDRAELDTRLWKERSLFEYWAHAASIVLTEDYPIHRVMMRGWPAGDSPHARVVRDWLTANERLRLHVLERLEEAGPLPTGGFDDLAEVPWESSGWTAGRNAERMLDFLWRQGTVMVAGRDGRRRLWDLAERCLPDWTDREPLSSAETVARSAEHALRSLGVARPADIEQHFIRSRYPDLPVALAALERAGRVHRVRLGSTDAETWYVHDDTLPLLEAPDDGFSRTVLLSPFDNLICDRARTERLWDFVFRTEMYVPRAKRRYGYYVLPVLHGERLIGRIAPRFDRRAAVLTVEGVYAEPDAPASAAEPVAEAVAALAAFLGARTITYGGPVPDAWRAALHAR
ncbi:winged helix-turn-helix domain-containing protein [Streptosporangium pseudovulgare]|uniref:Winged helix-turn-helix domain-containing protein n=1 Tax=Streptosporangium pseudovulgare TaxID=35765 RepID=A0ABQ2R7F4_9ACTN|nr:crosslink repair DNA glycosylase YcaQ family protein [Streptosporangium pseudovulgare]GGQ12615.1 hypothetical protein GCM10010140_48610 [Streptosporangium pseudovulgare]